MIRTETDVSGGSVGSELKGRHAKSLKKELIRRIY